LECNTAACKRMNIAFPYDSWTLSDRQKFHAEVCIQVYQLSQHH
jgi:hypothetical protein